jgi:hypothetical protein
VKSWFARYRVVIGVALVTLVVLATGGYVWRTAARPAEQAQAHSGRLLTLIDQRGGNDAVSTAELSASDGARNPTGLRCQRVYTAGGTTVCLRLAGVGPTFEAAVLNSSGAVVKTIPLPGVPSRARVSASGKVVSWTVFVSGDSYVAPGGFSTRTGYYDLRTDTVVESLEVFHATVEGRPYAAADANYWGLTVASDDRTFYATFLGAGRRWLVKGDLSARTLETVRIGPECPSLSPDGKRIAYKKTTRWVGRWELAVLDLASGEERVLPDTSGIDDQAAWLDDRTLAYGAISGSTGKSSVYQVPADGSGKPVLVATEASSPVPMP